MGKKALVIGAAGGVGSLVTQLLVQDGGYDIIGTVMNQQQLDEVRTNVPSLLDAAIIDLADADSIAPALNPVLAKAGALDVVIICAAISPFGPLETTPLRALRRTLEINAVADLAIYQVAMPYLRKSKGRLVVISSMAGKVAFPFIGHYAASKHTLEALADVMRREAAEWGVEIVIIEPGGIKTPMVTEELASLVREKAGLTDEVRALYGRHYDIFENVLRDGYPKSTPPETVAQVIYEALTANPVQARYPVGPDAEAILGLAKTLTDRELDKFASLNAVNDSNPGAA
jgi:NAD(P)-dependent dehydrogenase (short-subunit alcohol dehydrogenase family)